MYLHSFLIIGVFSRLKIREMIILGIMLFSRLLLARSHCLKLVMNKKFNKRHADDAVPLREIIPQYDEKQCHPQWYVGKML